MKRKKQKATLHQKIHQHLRKHFHKHIHKVLHFSNHLHHSLLHIGELVAIVLMTVFSWSMLFANLTGYSEELYRNNSAETAQALVEAMENPWASLKKWNIISIREMDMDIENTFTKWYCTYGAARISPEFFPFIDEKTQQRTWWGNAVDRCKNAAETWYKIGNTPAQGALVVYDAWGRFWAYGHVGKVLHYDKSMKKIIVRDMAWVARGKMSDRRDDLTTAQVKCYIYNSKKVDDTDTPPTTIITTGVETTTTSTTTTPTTTTPTPTTPTPTTPTPTTPTPTTPTPTTPTTPQTSISKDLTLKLEKLSDIAEHFLTQNDLKIKLTSKSPIKLGEAASISIDITDKEWQKYTWLLPFSFTVLSTNDTLRPDISSIKLINDGKMDISILGQKIGKATTIISMDGTKIGEFSIEVM